MSSFFSKIGNYLSYKLSFLDDPEVKEHARQQAEQERLERQQAEEDAEARAEAKVEATAIDDKAKKDKNIAKKSKFRSVGENSGSISERILKIFWKILPYCIILYAGSITSNWLIGYGAPMRFLAFSILVFFYWKMPLATVIGCFLYILKFIIYNQLIMAEIAPYYSWLPLLEYEDSTWKRFVPFFWKGTALSTLKKKVVHEQYKNAFEVNMNTGTLPPKPYEDALAVTEAVGTLFGKQGFSRIIAAIKSAEVQLNSIEANSHGYAKDELQRRVDPVMQALKPAAAPSATPSATPSAAPATPSAAPATPSATPVAAPSVATPAAAPSATPAATPAATPR